VGDKERRFQIADAMVGDYKSPLLESECQDRIDGRGKHRVVAGLARLTGQSRIASILDAND
jgi:hypothetical protein